jgi:hypothetical protein
MTTDFNHPNLISMILTNDFQRAPRSKLPAHLHNKNQEEKLIRGTVREQEEERNAGNADLAHRCAQHTQLHSSPVAGRKGRQGAVAQEKLDNCELDCVLAPLRPQCAQAVAVVDATVDRVVGDDALDDELVAPSVVNLTVLPLWVRDVLCPGGACSCSIWCAGMNPSSRPCTTAPDLHPAGVGGPTVAKNRVGRRRQAGREKRGQEAL